MIKISFVDSSMNFGCKNPDDIERFKRELQDEKPFIAFQQEGETVFLNKSSIKKLVIRDEI
jgi:hypothetical protein